MAGIDLLPSNLVLIVAVVLVVVGLVVALFWFFKRAENLSDEDRLNIERAKIAWIGAIALGILVLVTGKKERNILHIGSGGVRVSGGTSASTLL